MRLTGIVVIIFFFSLFAEVSVRASEGELNNGGETVSDSRAIRSAILSEFLENKVTWEYDWTTAIFLYAAIRTQTDSDPDWQGALELAWREKPEAATMPDLAAMSLGAFALEERAKELPEVPKNVSKNIIAFSKEYFDTEPLNSSGVYDHVGKRHRFAWYWPPTYWLMPSSVWADSAVMYGLNGFLLARSEGDLEKENFFLEQVDRIHEHLIDPSTGLYWHAYFFTLDIRAPRWARGNLWMSLAYVDILEKIAPDNPYRHKLTEHFSSQMKALSKLVDEDEGLRTLLDKNDAEFETTASSLYAYAAMKGARLNLLDPWYAESGRKLAENLKKRLEWNSSDRATVRGISCPTTAIPWRFYYTHIVGECPNESYGVGAYLLMLSEL